MSEFMYQAGGRIKKSSKGNIHYKASELASNADSDLEGPKWQTGVRKRFPWIGLGAILGILGCVCGVVAILVTSNGKAQEEWPAYETWNWVNGTWKQRGQITPSVLLAIMNTISNVCLAIAIGQGVAIAWWRKALHGATVFELHKSWGFSASLVEVLTAGRTFNMVALAALAAKVALIDNLLLQRAAGSQAGFYTNNNVNISLPYIPELPAFYTGEFNPNGFTGAISDEFSKDIYHYSTSADTILFNDTWSYHWDPKSKSSVSSFDTRCSGTCEATVAAFGFSVDCSEPVDSTIFDITPSIVLASTNAVNDGTAPPANFSRTILNVNASSLLSGKPLNGFDGKTETFDYSAIIMNVTYARNTPTSGNLSDLAATTCTGRLVQRMCVLRPAILNYPVLITNVTGMATQDGIEISSNSTTTLTKLDLTSEAEPFLNGQVPGVEVVRPAYSPYNSSFDTNIQAVAVTMQALFGATVNMDYTNGTEGGYVPTATGANPISVWWEGSFAIRPNRTSCMINVVDPMPWLVSQLNSIMLRASIAAATDQDSGSPTFMNVHSENVNNNIPAVQTLDTLIYKSNYAFMAGAIVSMLFCVICVLPSYYGFWELGRKVTLGPMEIASAFQSPVLDGHTRGGEVDMVLREVGDRRVRYGELGSGHLGIAVPDEVARPISGRISTYHKA